MSRCVMGGSAIQARPSAKSDTVEAVWSVRRPIRSARRPKAPWRPHRASSRDLRGASGGPTWTFSPGDDETTVMVRGRLRVSAAEGVREGVLAGLGLSIGGSE